MDRRLAPTSRKSKKEIPVQSAVFWSAERDGDRGFSFPTIAPDFEVFRSKTTTNCVGACSTGRSSRTAIWERSGASDFREPRAS